MFQSLRHYWKINTTLLFGTALVVTVLTGAIIIGDSVRGSLRAIAHSRLGEIDYVLTRSDGLTYEAPSGIARALSEYEEIRQIVPVQIASATAKSAQSAARIGKVSLYGVDARFQLLYPADEFPADFDLSEHGFMPAILNQAVASELNVTIGDHILLSMTQHSAVDRENVFGHKATENVVNTMRVQVKQIVANDGPGAFGLQLSQQQPLNIFVPLQALLAQQAGGERVNAILLSTSDAFKADTLMQRLNNQIELADFGVRHVTGPDWIQLETDAVIFDDGVASGLLEVADRVESTSTAIFTYLANRIKHENQFTPYSTVSGIAFDAGRKTKDSKVATTQLLTDEIIINRWLARDLEASPGDSIELVWFAVGPGETLHEDSARFKVHSVIEQVGIGADSALSPRFPGIDDAVHLSDWDPPFLFDLASIRPTDETYWDNYKATPKAFVSLNTAQELWGSRFGSITAIRIKLGTAMDSDALLNSLQSVLPTIQPAQLAGIQLRATGQQHASGSRGATDFGGLFVGLSMFILVSALILASMVFRLAVEQRRNEIGLLTACGYTRQEILRKLGQEAMFLAGIGTMLGVCGAILYAEVMLHLLSTIWLPAVGTSRLALHLNVVHVCLGAISSLILVYLTIWITLRTLSRQNTIELIRGKIQPVLSYARGIRFSWAIIFIAVLLLIYAMVQSGANEFYYFGSGVLILSGLLLELRHASRRPRSGTASQDGVLTTMSMIVTNLSRQPGRATTVVTLIACATFLLVTVSGFESQTDADAATNPNTTGGFELIGETDIPIFRHLNNRVHLDELGFTTEEADLLENVDILQFRFLPGDDASCLNLYVPQQPRVLGVPEEMISHGGFRFQSTMRELGEPWQHLTEETDARIIPAFADYNSAQWILHKGLGESITLVADDGLPVQLELRGLFSRSIFQSELLISEANFFRFFGDAGGFRYFLVDAKDSDQAVITEQLEAALTEYGMDVTSTASRLDAYSAVQNTYISVFRMLGGLGLLLGTAGLGIFVLRGIFERRGELALLQAVGYVRHRISTIIIAENIVLVVLGLFIGAMSAIVAILPVIQNTPEQLPFASLSVWLLIVLLVGSIVSIIAVLSGTKSRLVEALGEIQ